MPAGPDESSHAEYDHRDRQQLPHGCATPEKPELSIRLADEFNQEAKRTVTDEKREKGYATAHTPTMESIEQGK